MKKIFLLVVLLIASTPQIFAQAITLNPEVVTNKLTVGTPSAITSAVFEANSTTKGILIPRMTTAQRNAITAPTAVTGLMVYDTDLKDLYIFNGFWKRATIGELPIVLFGNIANQGIVSGQNSATFGIGLSGVASAGNGLLGQTDSGTGVRGIATTTGVGSFFTAETGIAVSAANNSNFQATARLVNSTVGGKGLDVTGSMTLTTDIATGNAITATNSNATGTGIRGVGGTFGVYGLSANTGVIGDSFAGRGIEGNSQSGNGVGGFATTGIAGLFQNNSTTNPTTRILNLNVGQTALEVTGTMNLTSNLNLAPAAFFNNTNTNGIGLKSEGNHLGVHGVSNNGSGIYGYSTLGIGTSGASLSGFGVKGESGTGSGGVFVNNTNTNPTVKIENTTSGGTALDVNGAIKVSGTNPAAFKITSTVGNIINGSPVQPSVIVIPNTTMANNATDILIVTHAFGTYLNKPFGVFWNSTTNNWVIYLEELNTSMPVGTVFNVLVIKQ
ncbi:MAG: hypothetical protein MUF58_08360 [Arcicella sp.]|jgi:hypothetical protein|nr:hypothetical protein [Arcicella sp.]